MNLDLAIQNQVLNRSPMETAMYGVASNLGDGHYRLNAYKESEDIAESLMGNAVATYTPSAIEVRPPVEPQGEAKPKNSFTESVGVNYSVSYEAGSNSWSLNKMTPANGIKGFWSKLTGNGEMTPTPLITKSGANSLHRFLTTVENTDLPDDLKASIAQVCLKNTDNTGISEYVGGHVVVSDIDNPMYSDIIYEDPLEILASEYVKPKVLTGYAPVRNEIGDAQGSKVLPQTHIPSQQVPIHSHNWSPF
jgi:hypothetical protein